MFDICHELFRILKPGSQLVCGMDINRLAFLYSIKRGLKILKKLFEFFKAKEI